MSVGLSITLLQDNQVSNSKEIQGEVMGRVWSSVGFQLFFDKQSILVDHPPFTWQKIKCHVLHQRF